MRAVAHLQVLVSHLVVDPIRYELLIHHVAYQEEFVVGSQRLQGVTQRSGQPADLFPFLRRPVKDIGVEGTKTGFSGIDPIDDSI